MTPEPAPPLVLILGGTAEARALAETLAARPWRVVTSLAGRTGSPRPLPGAVRVGGFGGVGGLRAWLAAHRPAAVIDATHPFAATITAHATEACAAEGVPRLALVRPAWTPQPGWHAVASTAEAATLLPRLGRRAFLTVGAQGLEAFAAVPGVALIARVVTPPDPPPRGITLIVARGPFEVAAEEALLRRLAIDVLVTKASGGAATAAKLAAAAALGIPVVMIDRPAVAAAADPAATTPAEALAWLDERLDSAAPDAP